MRCAFHDLTSNGVAAIGLRIWIGSRGRTAGRRSRRRAGLVVDTEDAALSRPGEARHFPFPARRRIACRYVRSETRTGQTQRSAVAVCQAEIRVRANRQSVGLALEVQAVWPKRRTGKRPVSAAGIGDRRRVHYPLHERWKRSLARASVSAAEHGRWRVQSAQPRGLDALRARNRESRLARVHQPHAVAVSWWRTKLRLSISARQLPGHPYWRWKFRVSQGGRAGQCYSRR